jgi:hypothetical protein
MLMKVSERVRLRGRDVRGGPKSGKSGVGKRAATGCERLEPVQPRMSRITLPWTSVSR